MFTSEDYLYGWLLYILGGVGFMGCWWYLTAKIRVEELRTLLRVVAAVTMFMPWYASPDMNYLAPAVVIAGVEGIFDGEGAFWRAGGPLLVALAVGVAASLIFTLIRRVRHQKAQPTATS